MEALAPKRSASNVDPSGPKVLVVVNVAVAAAGVAVAATVTGPAGVVAAVGLAAAAVLVGVVVASDSSKTCGYRCWRRGSCPHGSRPSLAPRLLASVHLRELAAPLLPRTDPSAASSAEKEEGSGAMGSGLEIGRASCRERVYGLV